MEIAWESDGFLWIPMDRCGSIWIPMNSHGCLWNPMESDAFLWMPMDAYGCLCDLRFEILNLQFGGSKKRERKYDNTCERARWGRNWSRNFGSQWATKACEGRADN